MSRIHPLLCSLQNAGISLPQCGVCPASSVGSGTVGLFSDIFLEDNWMVCTLPHLNRLVEVLRMRLGNFTLGHYQEVHTYG